MKRVPAFQVDSQATVHLHQGFHDPASHPLLEPEILVACPACGLRVGARRGVLNKHRVRSPRGDDPAWTDGTLRASPLGPDGWCTARAT